MENIDVLLILRKLCFVHTCKFYVVGSSHVKLMSSDGQGFGKPLGYKDKGKEGKGQGTDFETLDKPLPFCRGQGSAIDATFMYQYWELTQVTLYIYMGKSPPAKK
jgi:hypothetical protein